MFQIWYLTISLVLLPLPADAADAESDVDKQPTHRQTKVIELDDAEGKLELNAFCLHQSGHIVAVCGNGPGEVRIINDDGTVLKSWPTDVMPEAVTTNDDGEILVAGGGQLFRFDATGKELQRAEAPHSQSFRTDTKRLRKTAITQLKARDSRNVLASRIAVYERVLKQLEAKGKTTQLNEQEMRMLELIPTNLDKFRQQAVEENEKSGKSTDPTEEQIQNLINRMVQSRLSISSISCNGDHVFVATQGAAGFGYDVWRTNGKFADGKKVISGLRGCCGQMDVQCSGKGVFVAENARYRVVRYDTDGTQLAKWGSRAGSDGEGFAPCCNPMNVCFNADGDVFTAESSTGQVKRFSPDGKLLSVVGAVDLTPGCRNVSVGVSANADKVYVLDLMRNRIVLMLRKPNPTAESNSNQPDKE